MLIWRRCIPSWCLTWCIISISATYKVWAIYFHRYFIYWMKKYPRFGVSSVSCTEWWVVFLIAFNYYRHSLQRYDCVVEDGRDFDLSLSSYFFFLFLLIRRLYCWTIYEVKRTINRNIGYIGSFSFAMGNFDYIFYNQPRLKLFNAGHD